MLNRGRRICMASAGLLIFSVATYFQLQASLGVSPWNSLNQGLSVRFHITFGMASILVSMAVILADLFLKEHIGIGTFLDAFLVGIGVDVCNSLNFLPIPSTLFMRLLFIFIGIVIGCFGQALYMKAALSCGPRDAFLVGLGKRLPKVPIGAVNIMILAVVLLVCLPLKSPIGIGTVICAFGTGIVMEAVFGLLHFKPRDVVHEGILETCTAMAEAVKKDLASHGHGPLGHGHV